MPEHNELTGAALHGPVFSCTTHITSAQLLDLHNTPVELVRSPGPGKVVWPVTGYFSYARGSVSYAGGAGFWIGHLHAGVVEDCLDVPSGLVTAASSMRACAPILLDLETSTLADDSPLALTYADSSLSNGDGTLDVTVVYLVVG